MSASPTRYYASRPGSRSVSRPQSPQNASEVRSQAVAKLKRAASLPRKSDGRRPDHLPLKVDNGSATNVEVVDEDLGQAEDEYEPGPSSPYDDEEVLSPSPVNEHFIPAEMYAQHSTPGLQRSGSSSSSYHIPTPPQLTFGQMGAACYNTTPSSSSATPDWAAMQLAQSYLPSLSPVAFPSSPYFAPTQPDPPPASGTGAGRHTPSPLPTLGDLRNLQRSNSAAARAHAMSKLTGGRDTPSEDGNRAPTPLVQPQSSLQRAGTLGAPRFLGMPQPTLETMSPIASTAHEAPDLSPIQPRPRLQRSFTVSSSNMGEERRSAVGRRMVERLAERRAARQKEEEEVRRLWEERRAAADASNEPSDDEQEDENDQAVDEEDDDLTETIPSFSRTSPVEEQRRPNRLNGPGAESGLLVPDRPSSRGTMRSTDEPFQYESHLRRSLSNRTARGAPAVMAEFHQRTMALQPPPHTPQNEERDRFDSSVKRDLTLGDATLGHGRPPFATPTRHALRDSPSTDLALAANVSPGESIISRDALGSMMFIMGGGPPGSNRIRSGENWPSEVEENSGSDWGTPGREQIGGPSESPLGHSPLASRQSSLPPQPPPKDLPRMPSINSSAETSDSGLTPPGPSTRNSTMSWEELGGPEDRAVPSDTLYHKKSGSMSAKLGRKIGTAMRKRSQSRSSAGSSMAGEPLSPNSLSVAFQSFGRRGSEASLSPGSIGALRSVMDGSPNTLTTAGDHVRHQSSISSLSPSFSQADSAHNSLLQHQLAENPTQVSLLPRAKLDDPRINSKLSPFPGISRWECVSPDPTPDTSPKIVPRPDLPMNGTSRSQHGNTESILSLPPGADVSKRASDDSVNKKSWLSKAFGQQTSPRSSGSMSRQGSVSRDVRLEASPNTAPNPQYLLSAPLPVDVDPFAPPPAPPIRPLPLYHRSQSPSVSVVPEVSEEGSRLTRFTQGRGATPRIEEQHAKLAPNPENAAAHTASDDIEQKMKRLDWMLGLNSEDPARPDLMDDPPRKLLLAHQVLQVVNSQTVKDRFILLFNDILVIAKPVLSRSLHATLDTDLMVKSVIPLHRIRVSGFDTDTGPGPSPALQNFVDQFAEDPFAAVDHLVDKAQARANTVALANILFHASQIDREQLGNYLASNERVLKAFMDKSQYLDIRIDEALRHFLLAVRPPSSISPSDPDRSQMLFRNFAKYHFEVNLSILPYSRELSIDLVFSILELHDSHHGVYGYGEHGTNLSLDEFIREFRTQDPHRLVPAKTLEDIYFEVSRNVMRQAMTTHAYLEVGRQIDITPKIPTKLSFNTWSERITVSIPDPDPDFQIHLRGEGLEFNPPILDFSESIEASFTFRGKALGSTSIIFDRQGQHAIYYSDIGIGKSIDIQRAFMRHTFPLEFASSSGSKRKYCFSLAHSDTYARWANHLPKQVKQAKEISARVPVTVRERLRYAAERMALAVLQDALIPPPQEETPLLNGDSAKARAQSLRRTRSGSVSVAYGAQQHEEKLGSSSSCLAQSQMNGNGHTTEDTDCIQTGKELVLVCRQNSLLPGVLELLEPGFGGLGTRPFANVNGDARSGRSTPIKLPVRTVSKSGRSTPLASRTDPPLSARSRSATPMGLQRVESERRGVGGMV